MGALESSPALHAFRTSFLTQVAVAIESRYGEAIVYGTTLCLICLFLQLIILTLFSIYDCSDDDADFFSYYGPSEFVLEQLSSLQVGEGRDWLH